MWESEAVLRRQHLFHRLLTEMQRIYLVSLVTLLFWGGWYVTLLSPLLFLIAVRNIQLLYALLFDALKVLRFGFELITFAGISAWLVSIWEDAWPFYWRKQRLAVHSYYWQRNIVRLRFSRRNIKSINRQRQIPPMIINFAGALFSYQRKLFRFLDLGEISVHWFHCDFAQVSHGLFPIFLQLDARIIQYYRDARIRYHYVTFLIGGVLTGGRLPYKRVEIHLCSLIKLFLRICMFYFFRGVALLGFEHVDAAVGGEKVSILDLWAHMRLQNLLSICRICFGFGALLFRSGCPWWSI